MSPPRAAAAELNESQRRTLVVTLKHIDSLLEEAARAAVAPPLESSAARSELAPAERDVLLDYIAQARTRLVEAARSLGLSLPRPAISVGAVVQTNLISAEIDLEEVAPRRLQGFGPLGDETSELVARLESDVSRSLERIRSFLVRRTSRDLSARLARLERAPFDLELLRSIAEIAQRRGLLEFRPAIEALLERAEAQTFELALFGRVSSGKSSLINAVLGSNVLPTGATPVTAVPTRVVWGEVPSATIQHADAPAETVGIEQLARFVTEANNPGNQKRVVRVTVRLPAEPLKTGMAIVDTPGVGSLATAGARETFAYLPQCDLGVVLIGAGGAVERADMELLQLLHESGISTMVVISKADLLAEAEQAQMRDYVRAEVSRSAGFDVSVQLVSAIAGHALLARLCFERELAPLLDRVRELAAASARRKLSGLLQAVTANLRTALGAPSGREPASSSSPGPGGGAIEHRVLEAEGILMNASQKCLEVAEQLGSSRERVLTRAARDIAERIRAGEAADPVGLLRATLEAVTLDARAVQQQVLAAARDRLSSLLAAMAAELSWPSKTEPITLDLVSQPALAVPHELEELQVSLPRWRRAIGDLLERSLSSRLSERLQVPLDGALGAYGNDLRTWSEQAVTRLAERFSLQAEPMRMHVTRPRPAASGEADATGLAADLSLLEAAGQRD